VGGIPELSGYMVLKLLEGKGTCGGWDS
jgi:hypothetical protein